MPVRARLLSLIEPELPSCVAFIERIDELRHDG
jgi:hypothetical protein